ncbi:hypothetical protein CYLTODRAFT_419553 [Cylindrobasidium torrendii FP15055 ss-10]|uniref:Transmembrane protein n=1 Tax=Cylindrobasidium torrendii FP15055 ss-10 TaxID=1314674 RepID=A0A0D7BJU3_9AGAR|nr:hypothetical protein CYLTODRAFT_419553 [Cylindrobasidium torrendii FP15055 ss-10]
MTPLDADAILITSWFNTALYTLQVFLTFWYLGQFETSKQSRYGLCGMLVVDLVCTIMVLISTRLYVVNYAGLEVVDVIFWTLPVSILMTFASATIEQAFFVSRYWNITKDKWLTGTIIIFILAHDSLAITTVVYVSANSTAQYTSAGTKYTIASGAICAATDVLIASALTWRVNKIHTFYASTRNILRRVGFFAVTCGFTTAAWTIIMIVTLFTALNGWFFVFYTLGRAYSLTLLGNLILLRLANAKDSTVSGSSNYNTALSEPVVLTPLQFSHDSSLRMNNHSVKPQSVDLERQGRQGRISFVDPSLLDRQRHNVDPRDNVKSLP